MTALWLALVGCATAAGTGDGDGDGDLPDASLPDAAPDAPPEPVTLTLSQTSSETVTDATESFVACNNSTGTRENSWYRVFELPDFGVTGPFSTETVSLGVRLVDADGGELTITVKLHTLAGSSLVTTDLTELTSTQIQLGDQQLTNVDVPLVTEVPADATLVAEVFAPDLNDTGTGFVIGANNEAQTDQAFFRAPACDFPEPVTMAAAGQPAAATVLTVTGTY